MANIDEGMKATGRMWGYTAVFVFVLFGASLFLPHDDPLPKLSIWLLIAGSICAMVSIGRKARRPVVYQELPGTQVPTLAALVPGVCVLASVNICAAILAFRPESLLGDLFSGKGGAASIVFVSFGVGVAVSRMLESLGYPPFKRVED